MTTLSHNAIAKQVRFHHVENLTISGDILNGDLKDNPSNLLIIDDFMLYCFYGKKRKSIINSFQGNIEALHYFAQQTDTDSIAIVYSDEETDDVTVFSGISWV